MATLLVELSLTRIFSVVFYYHFAFLAISIALFGLGAGGVFSYAVAGWKGNLFSKLGHLSAINSVLVIVAVLVVLEQGRNPSAWYLALIYFTCALPFFVAGAVVSLAVSETIDRVNRVYFFDLAGAAGGCLLLLPLLNTLGGPDTTIVAAVLFAAAAAIWHGMSDSVTARATSVALALLLFGLLLFNKQYGLITVVYAKNQKLEHESFVQWNSFSRIAIAPEKSSGAPTIFIDADASTGIANFDFAHLSAHDLHDLLYQGPGLPYAIRPAAKTLIIGPGGGWDVARALASGSRDITGVEINPIIATTIMRQRFPQLSRGLYLRPDVHIFVEDGRAFVRRSSEKYQVLQATLVDTWASTAAGAFALSESNLYTTDAFQDYLTHLTDDGILAFTRWGFDPPRESLRLISLAMVALRDLGEAEPQRHIIVGREGSRADLAGWGARDTVLISRRPFSGEDIGRARHTLAEAHMTAVYLPDERIPNQFTELLHSSDPGAYERRYPFDITPVSDNRPFFFYTVQPQDLWNFITHASTRSEDYKINKAVPLLFELLGISVVATLIVLALPPAGIADPSAARKVGARVSALFSRHRRGIHPHRSGPDPEIRLVPGAPDLRADRGDFLAAGIERHRQLRERQGYRIISREMAGGARRHRASHRASRCRRNGAAPKSHYFAHRLESSRQRGADLSGRISHGHAVPHGSGAPGEMAKRLGALGVVAQCRVERARFGGGARVGHLLGSGPDAADRRCPVSGRARHCGARSAPETTRTPLHSE